MNYEDQTRADLGGGFRDSQGFDLLANQRFPLLVLVFDIQFRPTSP